MPVMPGYIYADTPHEKTVKDASWRYGCHSDKVGDAPRGGVTQYIAHPWNANAGRRVVTAWLTMNCGHDMRGTDAACDQCKNR